MIKRFFFCALFFLMTMVPLCYAQSYSVTVVTDFTVGYSGDYTGVLSVEYFDGDDVSPRSFTIGPYSEPFTITLGAVKEYETIVICHYYLSYHGYKLENWNISALVAGEFIFTPIDDTVITVSADENRPHINAQANWKYSYAADSMRPPATLWFEYYGANSPEPDNKFHLQLETQHCKSKLKVYDLDIIYSQDLIQPESITLSSFFETAAIDQSVPGRINITGSFPEGLLITYPRNIASIDWLSLQEYRSNIDLEVNTYTGMEGNDMVAGLGVRGITVYSQYPHPPQTPSPAPPLQGGDVDGTGSVDIVDALKVAQYYVGIDVPGFIPGNADVNNSGSIDILDALMIAQYYVGIIGSE